MRNIDNKSMHKRNESSRRQEINYKVVEGSGVDLQTGVKFIRFVIEDVYVLEWHKKIVNRMQSFCEWKEVVEGSLNRSTSQAQF